MNPLISTILRPLVAVIVITAFVLGISYFVKSLNEVNSQTVTYYSEPYLNKLGLDIDQVGQVAGAFSSRIGILIGLERNEKETSKVYEGAQKEESESIEKDKDDSPADSEEKSEKPDSKEESEGEVLGEVDIDLTNVVTRFAVVADIHGNTENLEKALSKLSKQYINVIILPGDQTDLGLLPNLEKVKKILDDSGFEYYALPGDRDLWKSVGPENFVQVFGDNYIVFESEGVKVVMLDNSANYTVVPAEDISNFKNDIKDAKVVVIPQPVYHDIEGKTMGNVNEEVVSALIEQRDEILQIIRDSDAEIVISADHHFFSQIKDPEDENLKHVVIGALTDSRNLQKPRYAIVTFYKNGDFVVEDLPLE